ncbi:MarR family transcriptional regulator [Agromyces sp. NPDC056965]|uniref:MarR family transcriptional regulator n=1 Tax=Agromyces sp. NPDC056965 TaxID=3345983 RepID=UPI003630A115
MQSFDLDSADHGALIDELLRMQAVMETTVVPELVEPLLSIRLTMQQFKVLGILITEPDGTTVQALSKKLEVSLATMSGIVDRLTGQGMAARVEDPNDHRVRRVFATPKGLEVVQELLAARPHFSRLPLERLDIDDLRSLTRGLIALVHLVESEAAAAAAAEADEPEAESGPESPEH